MSLNSCISFLVDAILDSAAFVFGVSIVFILLSAGFGFAALTLVSSLVNLFVYCLSSFKVLFFIFGAIVFFLINLLFAGLLIGDTDFRGSGFAYSTGGSGASCSCSLASRSFSS